VCPKQRVEVEEAVGVLRQLPTGSTVALTSPEFLAQELFSHRGAGTLLLKGEVVLEVHSIDDHRFDRHALTALIEQAFGSQLPAHYWQEIAGQLRCVYVCATGRGLAVILRKKGVSYLDKFAVAPSAQGDKLGELLWDHMVAREKKLFWRSRPANRVNTWYYTRSDGAFKSSEWHVFWRGLQPSEVAGVVDCALQLPSTF